jgi:hypothetical protein
MAASNIGLCLPFACYHACNSLDMSLILMLVCVMQVLVIFSSLTIIPWNIFLLAYEVFIISLFVILCHKDEYF